MNLVLYYLVAGVAGVTGGEGFVSFTLAFCMMLVLGLFEDKMARLNEVIINTSATTVVSLPRKL